MWARRCWAQPGALPNVMGRGSTNSIVHYRLQTSTETRYPLPLQLIAKPVELIEDLAFKQFQFLLVCKIRTAVFLLGKKGSLEERKTKVWIPCLCLWVCFCKCYKPVLCSLPILLLHKWQSHISSKEKKEPNKQTNKILRVMWLQNIQTHFWPVLNLWIKFVQSFMHTFYAAKKSDAQFMLERQRKKHRQGVGTRCVSGAYFSWPDFESAGLQSTAIWKCQWPRTGSISLSFSSTPKKPEIHSPTNCCVKWIQE